MNIPRRILVAAALLTVAVAALAQPGPGAYGPLGQAIVPLYGNLQGAYSKGLVSGTMAGGLAAGSPVYAFRYGGTGIAVIRSVVLSASDITTLMGAGGPCHFDVFAARAFTASDTGGTAGTLTTNNGKLRTSFATTAVSQIMIATTATNTAGTRTLDTDPAVSVQCSNAAAGQALIAPSEIMPNKGIAGDYPLALANNEGFVIQATVAATGTWQLSVTTDWEEFSQY